MIELTPVSLIPFLITAVIFSKSIQWDKFKPFNLLSIIIVSLCIAFLINEVIDSSIFLYTHYIANGVRIVNSIIWRSFIELLVIFFLSWILIKRK